VQELNAPSRRRAAKRPGLPDAFTTPPLSPLNSLTPLSSGGGGGGGGSSAKKQATAAAGDRAGPVSATGTPVVANGSAAVAGSTGGTRPVTSATP